MSTIVFSQDFFKTIPEYPTAYTANTVTIRIIDGLGYRYFWATEQVTAGDLSYQITPESRSLRETLDHILNLSAMIHSTIAGEVFDRNTGATAMDWPLLRKTTLENLQNARNLLLDTKDIASAKIDFGSDRTLPFWNAINGPIEDAVWHTGQVVMMRRAAGNPIPKGVNVLMGKTN